MKCWCPKNGEFYFYIDDYDEIYKAMWVDSRIDKLRFQNHNVFQTKKEAKIELERRSVERKLLGLSDSDFGLHWTIGYDEFEEKFVVKSFDVIYSPYRFATKDSALEAIKIIGEDKLKLIFRRNENVK